MRNVKRPVNEIIGDRVRMVRLFRDLTEAQAAQALGIPLVHYRMLEAGSHEFSPDDLLRLSCVLGTTWKMLLNLETKEALDGGRRGARAVHAMLKVRVAALKPSAFGDFSHYRGQSVRGRGKFKSTAEI